MVAEPQAQYGDSHSRNVLEKYISHYNEMFGTNFSTKDSQTFTTIIMILPKEFAVKKLT